jgi:hypothetical protein
VALRSTLIVSQLYHTKLEQLTTLTNRLSALSRTLGPDFYAGDLFNDTEYRDVSPERFSKLEKELVRGKGEVVSATRTAYIFLAKSSAI